MWFHGPLLQVVNTSPIRNKLHYPLPARLPAYTIYAIVVRSHDIPRKEPHNVLPARIP